MGQHSEDLNAAEQWAAVPPFIRGLMYGITVIILLSMTMIVVAGCLWLIGHPLANQCHI